MRVNAMKARPRRRGKAVEQRQIVEIPRHTRAGDRDVDDLAGGDALREKQPKLGALMGASREDVLAYMGLPCENWP